MRMAKQPRPKRQPMYVARCVLDKPGVVTLIDGRCGNAWTGVKAATAFLEQYGAGVWEFYRLVKVKQINLNRRRSSTT